MGNDNEAGPVPDRPVSLSVVITCYNYGDYVAEAIDSLLNQPGEPVEIIVVDDCSTDNSRDIISGYAERFPGRVQPVFQAENGGHGAGFNAGFARSTGDLVMFLDADDFMLPGGVDLILRNYDPAVSVYHYRMHYTNPQSEIGEGLYPPLQERLAEGAEASERLRETGRYNATITSGLVFSRKVLEQVMPMDNESFRQGADGYLVAVAPLYGPVRSFEAPLSAYRLHQRQHSSRAAEKQNPYARLARWRIGHDVERYRVIRDHSARLGLPVATDLGARDELDLMERLVSIVFEPESHPFPEDSATGLITRIRHLQTAQRSGVGRLFASAYWTAIRLSSSGLRRGLLRLRIDPTARPQWMKSTARFLRRRLKVPMP